jgi:hypothetical protein
MADAIEEIEAVLNLCLWVVARDVEWRIAFQVWPRIASFQTRDANEAIPLFSSHLTIQGELHLTASA